MPSLKEKSCGNPSAVDNGGMIEIIDDRQTEANTESEANVRPSEISIFFLQYKIRLGLRSPNVKRSKKVYFVYPY